MTEDILNELVKKAQKGDLRAFEQLVEQYHARIYNIALGIMGNPHDAEDAAQNALIKIYRAVGDFKFQSKLSTWIYRITTNVCMDEMRKRKRSKSVSSDDLPEDAFGADHATPEAHALSQESIADLKCAIACLKDEHRKVIVLRDINGFSYEEIADITKCSVGTVKSRISRARTALKDTLVSSGYFNR